MEKIYTVSEITHLIKNLLEDDFSGIRIEGEVSNFRPSSTGHYYFSLKDQDAVISVVMFRNRITRLKLVLRDGMLVKAYGNLSVYPKRGTYQLICESLEESGEGNILALLEERKKRLAQEGLFDSDRKKSLPLLPAYIAVITSPTGAAIRDILRVLKRRNSGINLVILPTPVQGDEAAARIVEQIDTANRFGMGDVLIVGRGGGSLEDLLPFSEEGVVRAIALSRIPVISAVGHETDLTLSDLAADVRAPTPSAAAELVAASREELLRNILEIESLLKSTVIRLLEKTRLILKSFSRENLERNFSLIFQPYMLRFDDAKELLINEIKEKLIRARHRLELVSRELKVQSPFDILKRGFAVVTLCRTGNVLRSASETLTGDSVDIRLSAGRLLAEVREVKD